MFDLNKFIRTYVTKRPQSMFMQDIESNREELSRKIKGKSVLVIGGAGFYWVIFHQSSSSI